jgi:hypothetical protein
MSILWCRQDALPGTGRREGEDLLQMLQDTKARQGDDWKSKDSLKPALALLVGLLMGLLVGFVACAEWVGK